MENMFLRLGDPEYTSGGAGGAMGLAEKFSRLDYSHLRGGVKTAVSAAPFAKIPFAKSPGASGSSVLPRMHLLETSSHLRSLRLLSF